MERIGNKGRERITKGEDRKVCTCGLAAVDTRAAPL